MGSQDVDWEADRDDFLEQVGNAVLQWQKLKML